MKGDQSALVKFMNVFFSDTFFKPSFCILMRIIRWSDPNAVFFDQLQADRQLVETMDRGDAGCVVTLFEASSFSVSVANPSGY